MATYDIYITTVDPAAVRGFQLFDFGGTRPAGITGFYKTVLQWLKCLMTEPGSDMHNRAYGTEFASMLGKFNNNVDLLRDCVSISLQSATAIIQAAQQLSGASAEERLDKAEFTDLVVKDDAADIYVTLRNVAGTTLRLVVPTGLRAPLSSPE